MGQFALLQDVWGLNWKTCVLEAGINNLKAYLLTFSVVGTGCWLMASVTVLVGLTR